MDFEKRIAEIYQRCRQHEEIKEAFDQLQLELNFEINEAMTRTRQQLHENFDDEVREKLKVRDESSKAFLSRYERLLMQMTQHELNGCTEFIDDSSFRLNSNPFVGSNEDIPHGLYELPRRSGEAHLYRLGHALADAVVAQAKDRRLPVAEVQFDYGAHEGRVTVLEPLLEQSGWLSLSLLTVEALDQAEDYLIIAAVTDGGRELEEEAARRLLSLPGRAIGKTDADGATLLESITQRRREAIQRTISERNARFFEAESEKLEGWADDLKLGLEREIKELDREIKETRRAAKGAVSLEAKLAGQKQIKALESQRSLKRRSLFDAQDEVDKQREQLIAHIEGKLDQRMSNSTQFTVRWILR